jgi:cytochrome c556
MRRVSILIGVCALTALAITVMAQVTDLSPIMKNMQPTLMKLRTDAGSNMADAAKDADQLQKMFKDAETFFKAKGAGAADAVKWTQDAQTAAADAAKAAKANDAEGVNKASKTIAGTCKACHDVHREQLPDKTFKYKP